MTGVPFVGKVCVTSDETTMEWRIANFIPMMSKEPGTYYCSPYFAFSDTLCYLKIHPNGIEDQSEGFIGLHVSLRDKQECDIYCTASLIDGDQYPENCSEFTMEFNTAYGGWSKFCKTSELMRRSYEMLPGGGLTIRFEIKSEGTRLVGITRFQRLLDLCRDLKKMVTGKTTDLVFKFKKREIPAHKMILQNRSEYFEAMFDHDTVENRTGVITVDDIEPDVFELVLSYIYCGEVKELTTDNMCRLYLAADKYQMADLKKLCLTFMEENVSEDLFCDILAVADTCNEPALMQFCKESFMFNSKRIIKTEKWKSFHEQNIEVAFQLLLSVIEENDF